MSSAAEAEALLDRRNDGRRPFSSGAILGALGCSMLWGGNSVAVKIAEHAFPPLWMAGLRFGLGCLATGSWAFFTKVPLRLRSDQVPLVLVNGVLLFIQIGLFNLGTVWSTSTHSVILINLFPFFTALAAHWWLPDFPLSRRQLSGLAIAFGGVCVMFGDQLAAPKSDQLLGDLMLIVSAVLLGFKLTYVKTLLYRIHPLQIVFWEAVTTVPLFLVTSICLEPPAEFRVSMGPLLAIIYQGWAVSGLAFLAFTVLLARHSPNELSAFSFTTPLFGIIFGYLFLSEQPTTFLLLGGILIAVGIRQVNAR